MTKIPQKTLIRNIYDYYVKVNGNGFRNHLGASIIGNKCMRSLWYGFRWTLPAMFEGRLLRLFETGQQEEERIIRNLRDIGIEVWNQDDNGNQFRFKTLGGHFAGSLDGVVLGIPESAKIPHLLECKTSNDKYFKLIQKNGVQAEKPEHYAQMVIYMEFLELSRALYFVVNKNNDEIYTERIKENPAEAKRLILKAEQIIRSNTPPQGISDNPMHWECKFCNYWKLCFDEFVPAVNCRTCAHSTPVVDDDDEQIRIVTAYDEALDSFWHCAKYNSSIPAGEQAYKGCKHHLFIPDLIPYANVLNADTDANWIEYVHKIDGNVFRNVSKGNETDEAFSSDQLTSVETGGLDGKTTN